MVMDGANSCLAGRKGNYMLRVVSLLFSKLDINKLFT